MIDRSPVHESAMMLGTARPRTTEICRADTRAVAARTRWLRSQYQPYELPVSRSAIDRAHSMPKANGEHAPPAKLFWKWHAIATTTDMANRFESSSPEERSRASIMWVYEDQRSVEAIPLAYALQGRDRQRTMLIPNTLRIDRGNGSSIIDYRIHDGGVESRIVDSANLGTEFGWRPVSPKQLGWYVISNNVVAHWLRRRMGLRALLRACGRDCCSC